MKKKCYGQWNYWIWWSEFFFLVNLSELTIKSAIGFGRFVKILERKGPLLSMFSRIGLCLCLRTFLLRAMGLLDFVVWICFLSHLSEQTVQCEMAIYRQGSCTTLVHLVFLIFKVPVYFAYMSFNFVLVIIMHLDKSGYHPTWHWNILPKIPSKIEIVLIFIWQKKETEAIIVKDQDLEEEESRILMMGIKGFG